MTRLQIAGWVAAAVLVFWGVGAYNRLVSLRSRIAQAFAAVDAQIQKRHGLLLRWLQAASRLCEPPPATGAGSASASVVASASVGAVATGSTDVTSAVPAPAPNAGLPGTAALPAADRLSPAAERVHAAGLQLQAACDALRSRPNVARRAVSLRLAEQTLADARLHFSTRLPGAPTDADPPASQAAALQAGVLAQELSAADSTLGFACQQFNEASGGYNDALRQFPTWLVGWLFGFREAGTL